MTGQKPAWNPGPGQGYGPAGASQNLCAGPKGDLVDAPRVPWMDSVLSRSIHPHSDYGYPTRMMAVVMAAREIGPWSTDEKMGDAQIAAGLRDPASVFVHNFGKGPIEFVSAIYQTSDGKFGYTEPIPGGPNQAPAFKAFLQVPNDAVIVALIHSHIGGSSVTTSETASTIINHTWDLHPERFSPGDEKGFKEDRKGETLILLRNGDTERVTEILQTREPDIVWRAHFDKGFAEYMVSAGTGRLYEMLEPTDAGDKAIFRSGFLGRGGYEGVRALRAPRR